MSLDDSTLSILAHFTTILLPTPTTYTTLGSSKEETSATEPFSSECDVERTLFCGQTDEREGKNMKIGVKRVWVLVFVLILRIISPSCFVVVTYRSCQGRSMFGKRITVSLY